MFTVVAALVIALLPGPAAVPAFAAEDTDSICWLDIAGTEACPPVFAPAGIISPRALSGVTPAAADALRLFEDQAIVAVLTDHGLRETDRNAVLSYARPDVEANIWALIVKAFKTGVANRSPEQQAIVDWFSDLLTNSRQPGPKRAALEYAKFAGKDVDDLRQRLNANASEQEIKDFLTGTPSPYNIADTDQATGGYCKYHPPAPYESEYDGHLQQTCFTPCQNAFGCAPPTPAYDDFVKWGNVGTGVQPIDVDTWTEQGLIAGSTVFGGLGAELGGAGAGALLTNVIDGSALAQTLFPYAGAAPEFFSASAAEAFAPELADALSSALAAASEAAVDAGDAVFAEVVAEANEAAAAAFEVAIEQLAPKAAQLAELFIANSAAIGFGVGVAIAAVAIAVQVGINVANLDQLPGKLAAAVRQSHERVDAADYFTQEGGPSTLFSYFTDLLRPMPRTDITCDNGAVSVIWDSWTNGKVYPCPGG